MQKIINRKTDEIIIKEEGIVVKFLYQTKVGNIILKILIKPWLTKFVGKIMNSRISNIVTKHIIKKHKIDINNFVNNNFKSYNDFFTRKKKEEYLHFEKDSNILISPCDSKLSVYDINKNTKFKIKNSYYSISDLLDNNPISKEYENGKILIFRLAVDDYHRYCYIDNGKKDKNIYIKGVFHTVRDIALRKYNIYKKNTREYTIMDTENFKQVIEVDVGAIMVGKIRNHHQKHNFKKGEEKGYFEFGGSTIVLLFKSNTIEIDEDILKNSSNEIETIVHYGEQIGIKKKTSK